jgi:hypothetical protein
MKYCVALALLLMNGHFLWAQEYGYTHYNTREGLAGSTVYCMVQDNDGFLWFGTETGVSRFDGTHFRNFTKNEGLPNNEIIQMFADSKGRIWMAPFKNALCYYFKGKIFNAENDSLVKSLKVKSYVYRFAEDSKGNMLFLEKERLHVISSGNQVRYYDSLGNEPIEIGVAVSRNTSGNFNVIEKNKLYEFDIGGVPVFLKGLSPLSMNPNYLACSEDMLFWRTDTFKVGVLVFNSGKMLHQPLPLTHINLSILDKHRFAILSQNGVTVYSIDDSKGPQEFLPGMRVSGIMQDTEGSLWFCTLDNGIYRLNSEFITNRRFRNDNQLNLSVVCLTEYNNRIFAGSSNWSVYAFTPGQEKTVVYNLARHDTYALVTEVIPADKGKLIYGSTSDLGLIDPQAGSFQRRISNIVVKAISKSPAGLLVGTSRNVMVVDSQSLTIIDTIWKNRATTVYYNNDTVFIGTLEGLYMMLPDRSVKFMGDLFPEFKNRITHIRKAGNGTWWMSTFDEGILGWKPGQSPQKVTVKNGLTSNICYSIFLKEQDLWVGTNNGLNKIDLSKKDLPIKTFTIASGLLSNVIYAIYVRGTSVYLGTPEGLTYFNEEKITDYSQCKLQVTDIMAGNRIVSNNDSALVLSHAQRNIRIDYVGISYKSAGEIVYRYRLKGLDSTWNESKETFLEYQALPAGAYELQLQATNKFGVHSETISIPFIVEKSLTEKNWFRAVAALVFLAGFGTIVYLLTRRIRIREEKKTATARRISELEQLALKAQMNPHFIFNCLNSIQQYVMDTDIAGANKFISGFSRLVRQTLDFSSRQLISLEEEINYLTTYLELEKTRFENKFDYSVTIEKGIHTSEYYLQPMILQPFVENSIRHGIRYRRDKNGLITIGISQNANYIVCVLEDNGIGRKAAASQKSNLAINYQSKGMSLTADRIEMINKVSKQQINILVEDLEDEAGNGQGTRVTLAFPIVHNK